MTVSFRAFIDLPIYCLVLMLEALQRSIQRLAHSRDLLSTSERRSGRTCILYIPSFRIQRDSEQASYAFSLLSCAYESGLSVGALNALHE